MVFGIKVFTYSFDVFRSSLCTIFFVTDPNNPYVFRDFATITHVFIVGGGQADLYKVNDVPHGSLTHSWYDSKGLGMDRRINMEKEKTRKALNDLN